MVFNSSFSSLYFRSNTLLWFSWCRSVPDCLRHCLLKSQISSLASCQRTLIEILQEQMDLVDMYITMRAKLSLDSSKPRETRGYNQRSHKAPTPASLLRSTRCHQSASSCPDTPQPGSALQRFSIMIRRKNALIQNRVEDNSRCLSVLIQRGIVSPGSALQLLLKVSRKSYCFLSCDHVNLLVTMSNEWLLFYNLHINI